MRTIGRGSSRNGTATLFGLVLAGVAAAQPAAAGPEDRRALPVAAHAIGILAAFWLFGRLAGFT